MNIYIKLLCSNKKCGHVFEYYDFIYPSINDNGWAIFECPSCKYLTKLKVFNVDIAKTHPNVKDVYDEDLYLNHKEIDDIEEGEIEVILIATYVSQEVILKILEPNKEKVEIITLY